MIAKRTVGSRIKRYIPVYFLMLPGILYLIINNFVPLFGLVIAFKDINFRKGIFGSDWCGLDNFAFLFKTKDAWIITRNTILYNVVFTVLGFVVAIFIAILLSNVKGKAR